MRVNLLSLAALGLIISLAWPSHSLALSPEYESLFGRGIYYYDPASEGNCVAGGEAPTDAPAPYKTLFPEAAKEYNTPVALLSAIFIIENNGVTSTAAGTWSWPPKDKNWGVSSVGARGPFQFMPDTWSSYGVDGDKDGSTDINNLVDSAYSAANLLAANGGTVGAPDGTPGSENYLDEPSSIRSTVWNYNHSDEYVEATFGVYKEFLGQSSDTNSGCTSTGTWQWPIEPTGASAISACWKDWRSTYFHAGLDISAAAGTKIVAADGGTVLYSALVGGYGEAVVIDHKNGFWTLYGHMLEGSRKVETGDKVKKGQHIGDVGSTGKSTGNHLHLNLQNKFISPYGIAGTGDDTINPLTNGFSIPTDVTDGPGCSNYPDGGRDSPSL